MPSSVKSTKTAKKLKPLAPNRLPEPSELHHPFAFNKDKVILPLHVLIDVKYNVQAKKILKSGCIFIIRLKTIN